MKPKSAIISTLFAALTVSGTIGCSMCCGPYDYDYPTYGGKHERSDRAHGRVGSRFSDPYAGYNGESADANLMNTEPMPNSNKSRNGGDAERDIEKFRKEMEEKKMERIDPRETPNPSRGNTEQLPSPTEAGSDPTAMKPSWRQRLKQGGQLYSR